MMMKKIIFCLTFVLSLSSCVTMEQVNVSWEKTNASLIKKSIENMDVTEQVKDHVSKNENIIIAGIEDANTTDYSLLSNIEGLMIKEFVNNNYQVLERDLDLLFRLFSEHKQTYSHYKRNKKIENSFYSADNASILKETNYNLSYLQGASYDKQRASSKKLENFDQIINTNLASADKILSYRVIESGIIYDYDDEKLNYNEVEREARTILEARLIDAKTSKVLTVFTLDGVANDVIPEDNIDEYKNFSYKYYSHTLPKTHGNPVKNTVKDKINKVKPKSIGSFVGLSAVFLILVAIL